MSERPGVPTGPLAPEAAWEKPLTPEAARELVLTEVVPLGSEPVRLEECLGRVTAAEVRSPISLQPFDNSAMDGYALRAADTEGERPRLRLVGESRAGHPAERPVGEGEAIWISTGAKVPEGADAVLPVEDASEEGGRVLPAEAAGAGDRYVLPSRAARPGESIRRAGEDVEAGEALIPAGRQLRAAEVAVLAAAGVAEIECAQRPRVAILGSGDELIPPGRPLAPGQIHDSNTYALSALTKEAGAEVVHLAHLPDDAAATQRATTTALSTELHQLDHPVDSQVDAVRTPDALIVAGGVSVGRHDHVKAALAELGVEERFWRVALRPGGPTWFGVLPRDGGRPTLVFGLPGNPVSAMVTFHLFARPALRALAGLDPDAGRTRATLATAHRKLPGKAQYLRCRLELTDHGWRAHLTRERQGSHVLTSMLAADALAVIPADREEIAAGERVEVEVLGD
ncbi:MAG TPA: gephyrin-like molybdotransferase Glp [Solirubrobacterales bacterium]|nr:gephyrin-like molybdotransferase Glp [Solirubrobacterales bacterium]